MNKKIVALSNLAKLEVAESIYTALLGINPEVLSSVADSLAASVPVNQSESIHALVGFLIKSYNSIKYSSTYDHDAIKAQVVSAIRYLAQRISNEPDLKNDYLTIIEFLFDNLDKTNYITCPVTVALVGLDFMLFDDFKQRSFDALVKSKQMKLPLAESILRQLSNKSDNTSMSVFQSTRDYLESLKIEWSKSDVFSIYIKDINALLNKYPVKQQSDESEIIDIPTFDIKDLSTEEKISFLYREVQNNHNLQPENIGIWIADIISDFNETSLDGKEVLPDLYSINKFIMDFVEESFEHMEKARLNQDLHHFQYYKPLAGSIINEIAKHKNSQNLNAIASIIHGVLQFKGCGVVHLQDQFILMLPLILKQYGYEYSDIFNILYQSRNVVEKRTENITNKHLLHLIDEELSKLK